MKIRNLKPSLFILHDVKHTGGINYQVSDRNRRQLDKTEKVDWRTLRTIADVEAFNSARAARARIETLLRTETGAAVSDIPGGLFAPDNEQTRRALDEAQVKIQAIIQEYREQYPFANIRLSSRVVCFRITGENEQLLRALGEQVEDSLRALRQAVQDASPEAIRAALKGLRGLEKVLPETAGKAVQGLIERYRADAREIVAASKKQGAAVDAYKGKLDASPIAAAEFAVFGQAVPVEQVPAQDAQEFVVEESSAEVIPDADRAGLGYIESRPPSRIRESRPEVGQVEADLPKAANGDWD